MKKGLKGWLKSEMKKIYLSENVYPELAEYLRSLSYELHFVQEDPRFSEGVGDHADLRMCRCGAGERAVVLHAREEKLGGKYPENAAFCAVFLDNYMMHRLDITAPELLEYAGKTGRTLINVRQGYTRCSCVVVDGRSIITADEGIYRELCKYPDISVLKISQGYVLLPGFDYGFIGGASGRVGGEMVFNGDVSRHPDYLRIKEFIKERGLKLWFFNKALRDIGSIIEERTEKCPR